MKNFKGVDIHDQYISYIAWPFRTYKWRTLGTIHLIQKIVMNAFIVFRSKNVDLKIGIKQFAEMIATGLYDENWHLLYKSLISAPIAVRYHVQVNVDDLEIETRIRPSC